MDVSESVATVVDNLRTAKGISVNELSKTARIPRTTLIRRLAGDPFLISELERIAAVLDTRPSAIVRASERGY